MCEHIGPCRRRPNSSKMTSWHPIAGLRSRSSLKTMSEVNHICVFARNLKSVKTHQTMPTISTRSNLHTTTGNTTYAYGTAAQMALTSKARTVPHLSSNCGTARQHKLSDTHESMLSVWNLPLVTPNRSCCQERQTESSPGRAGWLESEIRPSSYPDS